MRPGEGTNVSGSSALMRHSIAWPRNSNVPTTLVQLFACREANLRLHQVHAGDHLGHRMLHLNARVHLDEVEIARTRRAEIRRFRRSNSRPLRSASTTCSPMRSPRRGVQRRSTATPPALSGGGAGASIRARRDESRCRAGRPAPEIRCAAAARSASPCKRSGCRRPAPPRPAPSETRRSIRVLVRTMRMPRPPPPSAALIISGKPISRGHSLGGRLRPAPRRGCPE